MTTNYFEPRRVLFEEQALNYPLGQQLWQRFKEENKEVRLIASHNRVTGIPGDTAAKKYGEAKKTLVVGVRRGKKMASCRPSADFQLVFSTSCPGMCEYCYLQTTLGRQPVVRIYVNIEEILAEAEKIMEENRPKITVFEGAATSDPLPVEQFSGSLARCITFFAKAPYGRFRFVTKFSSVDSLLDLEHNQKTEFRFSVNTPKIIHEYEHATPSLAERLEAAAKVYAAGYPLGFLIAPIFLTGGWQDAYTEMLQQLAAALPHGAKPTFECISHRFTAKAKRNITEIFPHTTLPLSEEERKYKYGQFGYGKYVFPAEEMKKAKIFFEESLAQVLPEAKLLYFV